MEQLSKNLLDFWNGLSMKARIGIGSAALLVVAALAAVTMVVKAPPNMAYIGSNFEEADAAQIVEVLEKEGVEYKLENNGRDILVNPEDVNLMRLKLASKGLPKAKTGYDLFDKTKLGITETGMRIDFQRATQGELEATLESLEQIDEASVFLNIAPDTSFLDSNATSTASVVLSLAGGAQLSQQQARSIKHLVSGAVPRLKAEEVVLTDQFGNPLGEESAMGSAGAGMELSEAQRQFRKRVEQDLEEKIMAVLDGGPYGIGEVRAVVSVDIDFRTVSSEREEYSPVVGDQGIESRVEEHRESSSDSSSSPGGVPGTTSNVPGYLGISGEGGSDGRSSSHDLSVDYLVNKAVTVEDLPAGSIVKRSATVALNAGEVWDEQIKASIEHMVGVAIGADKTKGDKVFVQAFAFRDQPAGDSESLAARARGGKSVATIAGWLIAVLMAGLLMLFLRGMAQKAYPGESYSLALAGAGDSVGALPDGTVSGPGGSMRLVDPLDTNVQNKQAQMRREISRLIDENPDQVRGLLRTWMIEDR